MNTVHVVGVVKKHFGLSQTPKGADKSAFSIKVEGLAGDGKAGDLYVTFFSRAAREAAIFKPGDRVLVTGNLNEYRPETGGSKVSLQGGTAELVDEYTQVNQVYQTGRVTKLSGEIKKDDGIKRYGFTSEVDNAGGFQSNGEFFVIAESDAGEEAERLKVGDKVLYTGKVSTKSWKGPDGQWVNATEIVASFVQHVRVPALADAVDTVPAPFPSEYVAAGSTFKDSDDIPF